MAQEDVEFLGIHQLAPEEFHCALFLWPGHDRVLPVWLSPIDGARLTARFAGFEHRRPTTYDLLVDALERTGGVESIEVTAYHEGVFMVDISVPGGTQQEPLDARISDALVVSEYFGKPVTVETEILQEQGVYISAADLREHFDISLGEQNSDSAPRKQEPSDTSASGDAAADADFTEMMRSLGLTEDELSGEAEDADSAHDDPPNSDRADAQKDSSTPSDTKETDVTKEENEEDED